jgi:2-keto-4-pentenoate hydratase/2-oxohepta-3-ene-1,7-dioic acid hydratase in catechol pathway
MHIIRFLDDTNEPRYGHAHHDGHATLLDGELLQGFEDTGRRVPVHKLLAPLEPAAILCIGLNYHEHAKETGLQPPMYPILFMKNPAALNNPEDPVIVPASCIDPPEVDYEAELAVVIGTAAKNVSARNALDHVVGYTIGNDISARRWQKNAGGGQWDRGKSFDTFCPLGPALVTADEISDPQTLRITCTLNGEVMQDAHTSDMIFPIAEMIAYLSTGMTLLPGTVILTGTPSGVGFTRTPPVYLKPGDTVEVTIDPIGTLRNTVVSER